jgi:DnaA family protein
VVTVADRSQQLPIPLTARVLNRFDNFSTGANGELVCRLKGLAVDGDGLGIWIVGETGSGKSHLLEASCQAADQAGRSVVYAPLSELPARAETLEAVEADLVALDDVEAWLGDLALETVLMGIYQSQLQRGGQLIVASREPARKADFVLPDLASRFRALPGYRVSLPDDRGLRDILTAAAHRQGLTLTEPVLDYWLHRAVRSLPALLDQLQRLDEQALAEQRAVTIPLIKETLSL